MDRIKKYLWAAGLFLAIVQLSAQEKSTLYFGAGINSFSADENDLEFLNSDLGFNAGFFTPLFKKARFNLGLNLSGSYSFAEDDFDEIPTIIPVVPSDGLTLDRSSNSVNQSILKFGLGPQFNFKLGEKFWFSPVIQGGYFKFDQDPVVIIQNATFNGESFTKDVLRQDEVSESGFFVKPALRLSFQLSKSWNIWGEGNYFIADVNTIQNQLIPAGEPNEQGQYFFDQVTEGRDFSSVENQTYLNSLGINFGLAYSFGGNNLNRQEGQTNPYFQNNTLTGEMPDDVFGTDNNSKSGNSEAATKAQDYNSSRSNKPSTIAFTNPLQERKEKKQRKHQLIGVLPKNNSNFEKLEEIKNFTWEVVGTPIANPQFVIEVSRIDRNQQSQRTYNAKTSRTSIAAREIFKEGKIAEGQYRWKVTETTTGSESDSRFFTISTCEIDFSITNEEIECLGYEGTDRKFKICFDSNYSSSSGDLTFANTGSGLSVFDQSYSALSYTLVAPNPTLQTQPGSSPGTVSYCFEVIVPAGVTEIGFGLQGDDLDPSPILCQPGVSLNFDELPDCICDDCEDIQLSFEDYIITMNGSTGNQFDINGNINVNVPVYGIEVQVQSYSYSANPSACTDGVSSVEESGMILMPGTTINGSSSLQLANETVSGSTGSNDNATKNIKYNSTSALTGPIPINLNVGLPGPLPGLDPDCCVIRYELCIKIKVFYDDSNCQSCVFTHCFTFNNQ